MNTNGKTRPGAGTPERATETAAFGEATISCNHSTTAAGRQRKASEFLSHGRENAVPLRHLKKLLEVDGRTVRLMIQPGAFSWDTDLCRQSDRLLSPSNEAEKTAFVRSMRHRAGEIMRTARAIEQAEG